MKRTKRLTLRSLGFGLLGTAVALLVQPNTRGVIIGFAANEYVHWRMAQLHPQNTDELWHANNAALDLDLRYASVFSGQGRRFVDAWTRNPDGSRKSWVDTTTSNLIARNLSYGTETESYYAPVFESANHAAFNWHYRRWKIWLETGLTVVGGAFTAWLGFFSVYFLIIGLVACVMLWGRVVPTPQSDTDRSPQIHQLNQGGDAPHHPTIHDVATPSPRIGWLVVWAMLFVVSVRDRRWIVRGVRTMSGRAPPCSKRRCPMRRAVATICCVLLAVLTPLITRADVVSFATGEQLAMVQGTTVEGALSYGRLKFVPWALLDGSKFEAMPMWQFGGTPDSLVVGPFVGMSYDATGTTPYFGAEIRGKLKLGPSMFLFRFAERHTRERMLSRFANLGLEAGPKKFRVRLSYQPIRRNDTTTQRLALKATVPYRGVKIGLEVRSSLDGHQRKGAMLDLVVPLK